MNSVMRMSVSSGNLNWWAATFWKEVYENELFLFDDVVVPVSWHEVLKKMETFIEAIK